MTAEHRLYIAATCPVDEDVLDIYELVVTTGALIEVEEIHATVRRLTAEPVFQEDLTDRLAEALGAHVLLRGRHSGVETTTQAGRVE